MPATRVQKASNTSTDTTSVTVSFAAATAGNLLVAFAGARGQPFTPWGSTPAGWSVALPAFSNSGSTTTPLLAVFYKVAAGGETSVVLTDSTFGLGNMIGIAEEWSGTTATPLDATATSDSGAASSVTASSGTTGTTAQADELAFAIYVTRLWQSTTSFTNSFVQDSRVTENANGTYPVSLIIGTKTLTAVGTAESSCTWDMSARNIGAIVTFKLTAPPDPLLTRRPRLAQPMFRGSY